MIRIDARSREQLERWIDGLEARERALERHPELTITLSNAVAIRAMNSWLAALIAHKTALREEPETRIEALKLSGAVIGELDPLPPGQLQQVLDYLERWLAAQDVRRAAHGQTLSAMIECEQFSSHELQALKRSFLEQDRRNQRADEVRELTDRRALRRRPRSPGTIETPKIKKRYIRCGRDQCRCANGELHGPYFYAYLSWKQRTRAVYLGKKVPSSDVVTRLASRVLNRRRPRRKPEGGRN